MPTRAGPATRDPGALPAVLSLAGLAFGVAFLTLLPGAVCWLTLGWVWGLAFGAAGLSLGCCLALIAAGPVVEPEQPACIARGCPCACHAGEEGRRG